MPIVSVRLESGSRFHAPCCSISRRRPCPTPSTTAAACRSKVWKRSERPSAVARVRLLAALCFDTSARSDGQLLHNLLNDSMTLALTEETDTSVGARPASAVPTRRCTCRCADQPPWRRRRRHSACGVGEGGGERKRGRRAELHRDPRPQSRRGTRGRHMSSATATACATTPKHVE